MLPQRRKEFEDFVNHLLMEFDTLSRATLEPLAKELCRLAYHEHSFLLKQCNEPTTAGEEAASVRRDERVMEIVKSFGVGGIDFGEARGCAYRILLPSGASNSFGGEGWIIPEIPFP